MKKFFVSICLVLALCATSVTAFAAEPTSATDVNTTTESAVTAVPRQQGLWYESDIWFMGLYNSPKLTPTKGTELRLWLKTDNACRVTVYETNIFGTYSQVYSEQFGAGDRDVSIVSKCNGREYLVQFRSDDGVTFSALVYER